MSDIEYSVITSDVIKRFDCTSISPVINALTFLPGIAVVIIHTVKPVLSGHSKIDKTKILMTNGSLMKVESIAECSTRGAFCNTILDLH